MSKKKTSRRQAKVKHRSWIQRLLLRYGWLLPIFAVLVGSGILLLTYAFASIPLPRDVRLPSSAEVYDVHGKLIELGTRLVSTRNAKCSASAKTLCSKVKL